MVDEAWRWQHLVPRHLHLSAGAPLPEEVIDDANATGVQLFHLRYGRLPRPMRRLHVSHKMSCPCGIHAIKPRNPHGFHTIYYLYYDTINRCCKIILFLNCANFKYDVLSHCSVANSRDRLFGLQDPQLAAGWGQQPWRRRAQGRQQHRGSTRCGVL